MGPKLLPLVDRKSGRRPLKVRLCGEQWQYNVEGYFGVRSRKNITVQLFVRRLVGLIYVAKRVPLRRLARAVPRLKMFLTFCRWQTFGRKHICISFVGDVPAKPFFIPRNVIHV